MVQRSGFSDHYWAAALRENVGEDEQGISRMVVSRRLDRHAVDDRLVDEE